MSAKERYKQIGFRTLGQYGNATLSLPGPCEYDVSHYVVWSILQPTGSQAAHPVLKYMICCRSAALAAKTGTYAAAAMPSREAQDRCDKYMACEQTHHHAPSNAAGSAGAALTAVGWIPTVSSSCVLVMPAFIAAAKPCSTLMPFSMSRMQLQILISACHDACKQHAKACKQGYSLATFTACS